MPVFEPPVPKSIRFAEAPRLGRSVLATCTVVPGSGGLPCPPHASTTRCRPSERRGRLAGAAKRRIRWASGPCSGCPRRRSPSAAGPDRDGGATRGQAGAVFGGPSRAGRPGRPRAIPWTERGSFTVACQRCRQIVPRRRRSTCSSSSFPLGVWLPWRRFDHRMTCPSCRKRAWCSVTLRRRTDRSAAATQAGAATSPSGSALVPGLLGGKPAASEPRPPGPGGRGRPARPAAR